MHWILACEYLPYFHKIRLAAVVARLLRLNLQHPSAQEMTEYGKQVEVDATELVASQTTKMPTLACRNYSRNIDYNRPHLSVVGFLDQNQCMHACSENRIKNLYIRSI